MKKYQFIETISEEEHDDFVVHHPLCNLLQSSKWGLVKENWKRAIVGLREDDKLVASAMILMKPLPLGFTMFYIPRGPVMDYENQVVVTTMLKNMQAYAKKHHCLFITFDPAIHANDYSIQEANENHYDNISGILNTLRGVGAKFKGFTTSIDDTIQPRYHANVMACDELENSVHKNTRKALSTVSKKMIEVTPFHEEGVERFASVMQCTEERKNIHLRGKDYFERLMHIYGEDAVIYLAQLPLKKLYEDTKARYDANVRDLEECPANAKKKRFTLEELNVSLTREVKELRENMERDGDIAVVSGALCVKYGNTSEILYAGMDDRYKRYMAPYASFYKCMTWSFDRGCAWCNMGGIEGNFKGGLTKFKANYNPIINEFIGEFDLPVYTSLYALSQSMMKLRVKLNKRK
ncbi:MAG: peptidoglycan bridge formation glycyltransferase FemA/FemB family protein [Longicatena sp.]